MMSTWNGRSTTAEWSSCRRVLLWFLADCRSAGHDRITVTLFDELQRDVDDHVFLSADIAQFSDTLEDGVRRHAVAGSGALRVQEEARVHACLPLHDCGSIHPGQLRDVGLDDLLGGRHDGGDVDTSRH